ncbi:ferredoxin [Pseudactinotalea sp. HY158]|uniref:ferredoxin n=1 Tax=Pseudactinotalea sp. HY158 TaxID=2654547 RepID=UPI00129D0FBA|nr:ferredoxin [Pseudactinotalea sp. HY158]QGH70598.1 ferredoxin [Pseudactinotalea sp. HY158]
MLISVNHDTCVASGNCGRIAPAVFANRLEDDGFVRLLDESPPESEWPAARRAARLCPSATIRIERDGS